MILEVCCGNIASVRAAVEGGAQRIELCRDLELDGLTPSREMVREAVSICHPAGTRVHVLIRSREGDFVYNQTEVDQMSSDIRMAKEEGADGIVIGALTRDGDIDTNACKQWIGKPLSPTLSPKGERVTVCFTFHRAFDVCRNPLEALETIIQLGCNRILTSGQAPSALEGVELLKQLVEKADGRITILAGAGVSPDNAREIIAMTGVTEIHGSLRTGLVTDVNKVKQILS